MIEVSGFICTHCKNAAVRNQKIFSSKIGVARHESRCYRNPDNKACSTCALWIVNPAFQDDFSGKESPRICSEEHDREDFDNGMSYPPYPQHDCEHWVRKTG